MCEFSHFNQICYVYLTFQGHFNLVFELTLKRKCIKRYKQLKYYHEICLKCEINLTKFG